MRSATDLHPYQQRAVEFQCANPHTALWMDVGLGKTAVTLTSITHLINSGQLNAVLVVAPLRVCRLVWRQEALKWSHTQHLKFSMVMGTRDQRTRALMQPADVFVINFENLQWLSETLHTYFVSKDRPLPFNGIVYDEIDKCSNSTTNRVKALKKVLSKFIWRTGLTGTPASNGYKDLHGQYLVLDEGQRLGTSKTQFRTRFYRKEGPYKEVAYADTEETIKQLIGDMTLEMSAEDYNPLPDMIINDIECELPDDLRARYNQMERDFFIALDSGAEKEMFNQASLTNTCCISEGTLVLTNKGLVPIERIDASYSIWDGIEFVNVSGSVYNGYKRVIECFGVMMTDDHLVLTVEGWRKSNDCTKNGIRRETVRLPDGYKTNSEELNRQVVVVGPMRLWERIGNDWFKSFSKSSSNQVVWVSSLGSNHGWEKRQGCSTPRDDQNTTLDNLEKHEVEMQLTFRQRLEKLRWSWNKSLSKMGRKFREFLGRCWTIISNTSDIGTARCKQRLHVGQLPLGKPSASSKQHSEQCDNPNSDWEDNCDASCSEIQSETNNNIQKNTTGVGGGRFNKTNVYDLINCGPRNRFVVKGHDGYVIVHNCQFSNGAIYPVAGMPLWEPVHDIKLDALEDIIEESNGQPILLSYAYRFDAERIMKRFAKINPINLTECKSESSLNSAMQKWASGECTLMIGHAASMGHGLDSLQNKGHILVWFGLNWSSRLTKQFNGRLRRQGQGVPVICHRILCKDTLDQAQGLRLADRDESEAALRSAIKEYRKSRESV